MPLSDGDVREILRLIDEAEGDEFELETEAYSLYVRQTLEPRPPARARAKPAGTTAAIVDTTTRDGNRTVSAESKGGQHQQRERIPLRFDRTRWIRLRRAPLKT